MKLGLALSGGAVRGTAHIGVLKVFEKYNIKPDVIAGTSAGSIVASLYAFGYSASEIENIVLNEKHFIDINYPGMLLGMISPRKKILGVSDGKKLETMLKKYTQDKKINEVQMPLCITSVEINQCKEVVFSSKPAHRFPSDYIVMNHIELYKAVRASCSLPFIFKPVMINDGNKTLTLVDGGVLENLPIESIKCMGADKIIGVNLGYNGYLKSDIDTGFEILSQSIDIMGYEINKLRSEIYYKDCYIFNPEIWDVGLLDTHKIKECIARGEEAAEKNIKDILGYIQK